MPHLGACGRRSVGLGGQIGVTDGDEGWPETSVSRALSEPQMDDVLAEHDAWPTDARPEQLRELCAPRSGSTAPHSITTLGKRRATIFRLVLIVVDLAVVLLSMALAFHLRTLLPGNDPAGAETRHTLLAVASLPAWIISFAYYELYSSHFVPTRLDEFRRIADAVGAAMLTTMVIAFAAQWYVARGWLLLTFALALVAVTVEREVVRRAVQRARRRGELLTRVVVVARIRKESRSVSTWWRARSSATR